MEAPRPRVPWWRRIWWSIWAHLILPYLESHSPLRQVAWGSAIGMFVAITPTVGIQMYIVTLIWLLCRYLFRTPFTLSVSIAMVWISNPITVAPLYYLFLQTGDLLFGLMGQEVHDMTFEAFKAQVQALEDAGGDNFFEWLYHAMVVLVVEFGWPMLIGSLLYAIPLSILSYPTTIMLLGRYRRRLADSAGMSYEEWRKKFEN